MGNFLEEKLKIQISKSTKRKIVGVTCTILKAVSSHMGLFILLLGLSLIGGSIFALVEGPAEYETKQGVVIARQTVFEGFWGISKSSGPKANWTFEASKLLAAYEEKLIAACVKGYIPNSPKKWTFWGSFFFTLSVYSTIGFGYVTPNTSTGRVITVFYGVIGIPLCMLIIIRTGRLFGKLLDCLWLLSVRLWYIVVHYSRILFTAILMRIPRFANKVTQRDWRGRSRESGRSRARTGDYIEESEAEQSQPVKVTESGSQHSDSEQESEGDADSDASSVRESTHFPPVLAVMIMIMYLCFGAITYKQWENWSYLDAFWFVFVLTTSLGFGNMQPEHPFSLLICTVFIFTGLSLMVMTIMVLRECYSNSLMRDRRKRKTDRASRPLPTPSVRIQINDDPIDEEERAGESEACNTQTISTTTTTTSNSRETTL